MLSLKIKDIRINTRLIGNYWLLVLVLGLCCNVVATRQAVSVFSVHCSFLYRTGVLSSTHHTVILFLSVFSASVIERRCTKLRDTIREWVVGTYYTSYLGTSFYYKSALQSHAITRMRSVLVFSKIMHEEHEPYSEYSTKYCPLPREACMCRIDRLVLGYSSIRVRV